MKKVIVLVISVNVSLGVLIFFYLTSSCTYSPLEAMRWDAEAFGAAVSSYEKSEGKLPSSDRGLEHLLGDYIVRIPNDPWGGTYKYASISGEELGFVIWSDSAPLEMGYQIKFIYIKTEDGFVETMYKSVSP